MLLALRAVFGGYFTFTQVAVLFFDPINGVPYFDMDKFVLFFDTLIIEKEVFFMSNFVLEFEVKR